MTGPKPPLNPHYERKYQTTISGGYAQVTIAAPGNVVSGEDAEHLIEWFGLITQRLKRDMEKAAAVQASTNEEKDGRD